MTKIHSPKDIIDNDERNFIPDGIDRYNLAFIFSQFVEEHLYDTKHFLKHFGDKRAIMELPFPSLLDTVKNSVCYDCEDNIDVRILYTLIHPNDKKLFVDLVTQVGERFINVKGKSPLTLYQFKVLLAYRMHQVGF